MRLALIIAVLCAGTARAAPEIVTPAIARFEAGVICPPETIGSRPAPGTVAGTTHVIEDEPPFVSVGDRVPGVIGIGFGVKVMSVAADGLAPVTMRVTHPPMGPDRVPEQTFLSSISGADPSLTFYQFDYDYEVLYGRWTMSAYLGETLLYQTSFEVVPARDLPELAGICGYENLLS